MKKKIGRNEPCPCGSGKKFKKCCESKMIGKKYLAHKLELGDQTLNKISSLSSLISSPVVEHVQELKKEQEISASDVKEKDAKIIEQDLQKESDAPTSDIKEKTSKKEVKKNSSTNIKKAVKKSTKTQKKTPSKKTKSESS